MSCRYAYAWTASPYTLISQTKKKINFAIKKNALRYTKC